MREAIHTNKAGELNPAQVTCVLWFLEIWVPLIL